MANIITRNIPNTITCCNLISGCIAIHFAFLCQPATALLCIIIGAVFDFFDGMTARLLGVSSPIGKELDSLADVITFGAAPATMVFSLLHTIDYPTALEPAREVLPYTAYIIAAFSALRLAKPRRASGNIFHRTAYTGKRTILGVADSRRRQCDNIIARHALCYPGTDIA